ncbi:xanthine dehydrogenase [Bacillus cereus]|uniref:Xanthine dehydrogenase n=1 Tax=Bacillus cereus TaxID=1396 RepID=A0A9X6U5J4_BACCE|nr:nucleotidyltransferase family protein [Bacillus cereus]PEN78898.1 xanthine dehydrogenase [Bacillus cereus]
MKVAGVFLAAGNSRRMGRGINKLCLPIGNQSIGSMALQVACDSQLDEIIIVTNDTTWISKDISRKRLHIVPSLFAQFGQSFSLYCGIKKAETLHAEAVIMLLADQLFITPEHINEVINRYKKNINLDYIVSCYRNNMGPPVLFSKKNFCILKKITGDQGARSIFNHPDLKNRSILYGKCNEFYDVDTIEDYTIVKEIVSSTRPP